MRAINSVKNALVATFSNVIAIIISIITQALFLKLLGDEYSGINSLFTTIMSMLAIVELGFGSAIIYNLYKPVHDNDKETIKSLLTFYRKTYNVIALCIFILGLIIMPFIKYIVGDISINENLYFIFFLYVVDVVVSYLLTYKRSILYANQKNYITNLVHIIYLVLMNTIAICLLVVYQNFILYLIIKIIFRFLENLFITVIANRMYPYITETNVVALDNEVKGDIITKVKGLLFHKIAGFIVMGTDNIIISMLLGIKMVAVYTNYKLIINSINDLLSGVFNSVTSSVGNLLVEGNHYNNYRVFKRISLLNSWITMFTTCLVFCIASPFVELVYGEKYVVPVMVLLVFCLNFYVTGMRRAYSIFKDAAGIFHEDRYVPVIESLINIVASVVIVLILKKYSLLWGLSGVFIGTIISSMLLFFYSYPKYVYRNIFKRHTSDYAKELFTNCLIAWITIGITYSITTLFVVNNLFIKIIINAFICIIIPNIIYVIIYGKSSEFKYFIDMIKFMLSKQKKKKI